MTQGLHTRHWCTNVITHGIEREDHGVTQDPSRARPTGPMADYLPGAWERHGTYEIKTEDRGHGIIAVYVKGPASEIESIQRASRAYARANLTFAPGLSAGPTSGGGGEFADGGKTFVSQDIYTTQPPAPRTD